jgi:hypothetical protein
MNKFNWNPNQSAILPLSTEHYEEIQELRRWAHHLWVSGIEGRAKASRIMKARDRMIITKQLNK